MSILSLGVAALSAVTAASKPQALPFAYALVVGSRDGGSGQTPLKYSVDDAGRFAQLLVELGRYGKDHVHFLRDPTPEQLLGELRSLQAELRDRQNRGEHSSLLFYYSGHARASGLSLGSRELALADLRDELTSTPADLVVAILDACQSGSFSRIKGVEPAPDFSINTVAQLNTRGLAVLASSTSSELSQESDRLAGSFFTHHLLMALRGAGDLDGDGRVTLTEAYRYAYSRTLVDTTATAVGSQHATLETNLRGKGDVALTYPKEANASLLLSQELQGDILLSLGDSIVGEINKAAGSPMRLGLPPARYRILVRQQDTLYECPTDLVEGHETLLALSSCTFSRFTPGTDKGEVAGGVFETPETSKKQGWHFEVRLDAPLSYTPNTAPSFRGTAQGSFTYYFDRLIDDRDHPLGTLTFLQHPSSISVQPSVQFSSSGVYSTFGGSLSTVFYPWQRTGFSLSAAGSFTGQGSGIGLALGFQHYLLPNWRIEMSYFGTRTLGDYVATDAVTRLSTTFRQDAGTVGTTALWAREKLLSRIALTYARTEEEFRGGSGNVGTPGVRHSLEPSFDAEYFLSRRVSIDGDVTVNFALPKGYASTAFGLTLNAYLSEAFLLTAGYQAILASAAPVHQINFGVAWRF